MTEERILTPDEYLKEAGNFTSAFELEFGKYVKFFGRKAASILITNDEKGNRLEKFFNTDDKLVGTRTVFSSLGYCEVVEYAFGKPCFRSVYDDNHTRLVSMEWLKGSLNAITKSVSYVRGEHGPMEIVKEYGRGGRVNKEIIKEKNKTTEKTLDRKGRVKREETTVVDGKGGEVVTLKDGKGKVIRQKTITVKGMDTDKETTTVTVKDGKGKIIHQQVYVNFQGKSVLMEPTRGWFSRIKGLLFGKKSDKGGAVVYRRYPKALWGTDRKYTCKSLEAILKDSSLSGTEKRVLMRKRVAEFRNRSSRKAPNKKVEKKLQAYLPQGKEGR